MTAPRRWALTYAGLALTYLAASVNLSVTSVALPSIATDLGATNSQLSWIFNVTPLASAGLMLFAGAWGDRYGRRRILVIGLVIFLASALLSAFAQDALQLIVFRALAGVGSALAMPPALALTFDVVPVDRRRTAVGVLGATQAGGALVGPVLAGALMQVWSWPAAFLSVAPFIVLALLAARGLPGRSTASSDPLDTLGATLISIASFLIAYCAVALSTRAVMPAVIAAVLAAGTMVLLVWHERRTTHPLFDAAVLRQSRFRLATLVVFGSQFVLGGLLFDMTQYLQLVLGYSALATGITLTPALLGWVLASVTASRSAAILGLRRAVAAGLALATVGLVILAVQDRDASKWMLLLGLFLAGLMAVGPALMTHMAVSCYPERLRTVGAATNGVAARLGFSFGIAIIGGTLGAIYASSVAGATTALTAPDAASVQGGLALALTVAAGIPDGAALAEAARTAFISGFSVSLFLAAFVVAALTLAVALSRVSEGVEDASHGSAGASL